MPLKGPFLVKFIRLYLAQAIVQGGMRVMAVNALGLGLAYVTHVVFAKWLGVADYGVYVYALAWLNVLTILAQVGLNTSTVRLTAELRGRNEKALIADLSRFSVVTVLFAGTGVVALSALALWLASDALEAAQVEVLTITLPLVVVLSLLYQRMAVLQGFERVAQAQVFLEIARPLALLALAGAAYVSFGLSATGAMAANIIATASALVVAVIVVRRFISVHAGALSRNARENYRAWLVMSLPYLAIGALTAVMQQSDILMLGSLMGGVAAGLYAPAVKLAQLVLFPMMAIRSRAAPLMAKLHAAGDLTDLQRQMNTTTVTSALTGVVLVAGLIWQRENLLGLFGPDFVAASPALVVLALGMGVFALTGGVEVFLIYGPFERVTMMIYAVVVGLNIALNVVLIPPFGVLGAAYATAATVTLRGVISAYVVWRHTGILPWAPLDGGLGAK